MKKNENEKVTITVSSRPNDMRGWFEEKSGRILEELSFLADTLHRPTKQEEADFHLSQTVKAALAIASISGERERPFKAEDVARITEGGRKGYLEYREGRKP